MIGPASRQRSDARRNHDRIITAALEVFAEQGLQATVPDVAARANVGKATVYRNYPAKEDLVSAIAQHQFGLLEQRTAAALSEPDPAVALTGYLAELFEWLARDRILAEALASATSVPTGRILAQVTRLVESAKPSGLIRPDATELDVRVVICGPVLQLIALGERDPAVWRRYADLTLRALQA
jgi:AcrR family transcriptional regulator